MRRLPRRRFSSLGAGVEFDSSAYPAIVARTRLPGRFRIGEGVSGWSLGLEVSH